MRAALVQTSTARMANSRWMGDKLAEYGLPLDKIEFLPAVMEEIKEPTKRQVRDGREQLKDALAEAKTCALLVGNVALESVTGKRGIKQRRGRPFEQDGNIYLPTLPPGTALYDARTIPMMEADLRLFAQIVRKGEIPREDALEYTIVDCERKFRDMLAALAGTVSFDIETTGLYPWADGAKVISIGFGTRDHQWCLPLHHPESTWAPETHARLMKAIDRRLRNCYLVAHNGKFDSLWMRVHYGVDWRCDFDTMLAHYMLDENSRHSLKLLAQVYFGAPNYDADLDTKQGAGPIDKHCLYLAHDVYYTRKLRTHLGKLLREDPAVDRLFERLMMPLARLFVDVEFHGVLVDYDRYEEAEVYLRGELKMAEKDIRKELKRCGVDFDNFKADRKGRPQPINLGSPQQLAKLFFEDLKLPIVDRTKGGKASTNESVLLRIDHPVARAMLKWRGADQNLKMFIDGWRGFLVKHEDGWRLHPSFKLHGTVTGRASCEHPNLQQVPRESMIRSLIGAPDGWDLLEIDLSQIEMRIAAELSGDETLLGLFDRDEDVHWLTATREIGRAAAMAKEVIETARMHTGKLHTYGDAIKIVFEMGPDRAMELMPVWKELRKKAKAVNFGYLFGMWWRKFIQYARDNYGVTVTEKQAQDSRRFFFATYRRLGPWHERQRRFAMRNGYVRSLTGGKRRLPDAQLPHDCPARGEAQRQAINSPVQRLACELNYMVLLQLVEEFGLDKIRPIGTVHDATLIEVKLEWMKRVHDRALEIMKRPRMLDEVFGVKLRVPVKGDAKIGPWSKGVSLDKWRAARKERARA